MAFRFASIVLTLFLAFAAPLHGDPEELVLVKALPVEGPDRFQPSGLAVWQGELYAVSDKHSDAIFRLETRDSVAQAVREIEWELSWFDMLWGLDWEGISVTAEGSFLLVSENHWRVFEVKPNGGGVGWVSPSLKAIGEGVGLFVHRNAYLEGIASLEPGYWIVCAERQPRGLIRADYRQEPPRMEAWKMASSKLDLPEGRSPDFAGLFAENGRLFALVRNAEAIVELEAAEDGSYREGAAWSYRKTVRDEAYRFQSTRFGNVEGMCADDRHVYLITDNNGEGRALDPSDQRPLLFVFERPASMKGHLDGEAEE